MIIYLILVVVGSLLLVGAVSALRGRLAFVKNGERSTGTVVQIVEKKDEDGLYYYPVFDIPSRKHETITYTHTTGSSSPTWQIGDTAAFIFTPGKPDTLLVLKFWEIFWWPLILIAVAADLLMIGGGYFLMRGYFGI
ncbi:hypothetical protein HHL17_24420 [Chitinophaga sp. G-6-1-13]|uniref:DUF3592 domain-containing protein n=1 Tax=Chitinophaga fulva TaxID=2728842 RepID=A0A848GP38_9BACT|nr:DUF3592 domain-containing protein [Chitinophaga fulva]NML40365.1 hypothetical protein [Chitinophaga fulva]